jgi:hypothetical protein
MAKWFASAGMSSRRSRREGRADGKHVQAEVKVLAKRTIGDFLFQISIRRGNYTNIDGNPSPFAAKPFDLSILEDMQQPGLAAQ